MFGPRFEGIGQNCDHNGEDTHFIKLSSEINKFKSFSGGKNP